MVASMPVDMHIAWLLASDGEGALVRLLGDSDIESSSSSPGRTRRTPPKSAGGGWGLLSRPMRGLQTRSLATPGAVFFFLSGETIGDS